MSNNGVQVFDGGGAEPAAPQTPPIDRLIEALEARRYVDGNFNHKTIRALVAGYADAPHDVVSNALAKLNATPLPPEHRDARIQRLMEKPLLWRYPERTALFGGICVVLALLTRLIIVHNPPEDAVYGVLGLWSVVSIVAGMIRWMTR